LYGALIISFATKKFQQVHLFRICKRNVWIKTSQYWSKT